MPRDVFKLFFFSFSRQYREMHVLSWLDGEMNRITESGWRLGSRIHDLQQSAGTVILKTHAHTQVQSHIIL